MKEKKKKLPILLGILFVAIALTVGVSYALWQLALQQESTNVITTGCFKINFTDENEINLAGAYPMTDKEGKELTPYTFTIENVCESSASYQINLEVLEDSTLTDLDYIKMMLNESKKSGKAKLLSSNDTVSTTLDNARLSYKLETSVLEANEEKIYNLRLWLDEDTPADDAYMNKTLESKVTIITSLGNTNDEMKNMMVAMETDTYEKWWGDITYNATYTQNGKYMDTLKSLVFESEINSYEEAEEVVDFSELQNESVLGYYVLNEDESTYTLYIQADGRITANPNASYYFSNGDEPILVEGLENIDTSQVTNMSNMFYYNKNSVLDLSSFDTSKVTDMSWMFHGMSNVTNLDLSSFDTSKVTNMSFMFSWCSRLTSLNLGDRFDTSNVADMSHMFGGMESVINLDLSSFDTSKVTNMSGMFYNTRSLTSLDLSSFDTSNVTDMSWMFTRTEGLTSLNLGNHFDTSKVTDMSLMFNGMSSVTSLDLGENFDTSNVTDMSDMFSGMSSVTSLDLGEKFDTSNVDNMKDMFSDMSSVTSLDLGEKFDTSNVDNMKGMFERMTSLKNLNLGAHFNTSNVTDMSYMFYGMSSLTSLDLSSFDTSNVIDMSYMFYNMSSLTTIVYGDNFIRKSNSNIRSMFENCPANRPTHESWNGAEF